MKILKLSSYNINNFYTNASNKIVLVFIFFIYKNGTITQETKIILKFDKQLVLKKITHYHYIAFHIVDF